MSNESEPGVELSQGERGWKQRFRKNLPFIVFIAVLAIYTSYLQLTMRDSLLQLFLVRNLVLPHALLRGTAALPAQVQPLDVAALDAGHAPGDPLSGAGRVLVHAGLGALGPGL